MSVVETMNEQPRPGGRERDVWTQLRRSPTAIGGAAILMIIGLAAILAPLIVGHDPFAMSPIDRLSPPSAVWLFGTDMYGRDIFSRSIHGARISMLIGLLVALASVAIGMIIGLVAGYVRILDNVTLRAMDGVMAIPGILLAIALIALTGASLTTVVVAIAIPEIPRVVRLVRGIVLSVREEPYVEAAVALGSRLPRILVFHVLPNTVAPLIVLATYTAASAIIVESILGFLGAGIPPEIPSWGNVMAEGRVFFRIAPWIIFFPGLLLGLTVLAVNMLGDALRDTLDPRLAKKM